YRNPYINLDKLYRKKNSTARYPPIENTPRLSVQVSRTCKDQVYISVHHPFNINGGTLSPPDRHLKISSDIHTIVQFRAIDFGMESCTLSLRLPPQHISTTYGYNVSKELTINVCNLNANGPLNIHRTTWRNRPACQFNIGQFIGRPGHTVSLSTGGEAYVFPCVWGSFHTFELSCSDATPDCAVDVWSNQNDTWGAWRLVLMFPWIQS
ncbi:hypothetical protein BU17DRAFT_53329, partial [Hysterangium stoloniferum]